MWRGISLRKTTLLGKDIEENLKTCPNVLVKCEFCGILKKRTGKHDCFEALMSQIKIADANCNKIERELGLDYDRLKTFCP